MVAFSELALRQRACRRFDPAAEVSDDEVIEMLTLAVHAPSAENSQPWEFVIVRSTETRSAFGTVVRQAWDAGGAEYVRNAAPARVFADIEDGIASGGLETAPVVIVVCADLRRVPEPWAAASIYPATQNLLLAAASLGFASCLTTGLTTVLADTVRELVSLPDSVVPMAGVFIGKPARVLGPPRRESAAAHAHRERFGAGW